MPIRRISAADAFATLKANPDSDWPRRDDPVNRFAHFADPSFKPRFMLEPGQRVFTIGSCFARGIERALVNRGFDVPTQGLQLEKGDWHGDPTAVLNNYVPPAIAPQIRWAFGMEPFDIDKHAVEVMPGRFFDLQLPLGFRPISAEALIRRRNDISAIYRQLESSQVVLITLGLIEAWFDNRSALYINCTPPKGAARDDPGRFQLHILDYNEVTQSLDALVTLLDQVCPRGHRIIFTVSPVPLQATFTDADVSVANSYSKSVLRAAVEPFVAGREHIEYFPSYESVVLTDRSIAFVDDQVHVETAMIRFNVDRMIHRYVRKQEESVAEIIALAREDAKAGVFRAGLKRLQRAWATHAGDPELAVALAEAHIRAGNGAAAETLLLDYFKTHEGLAARNLLARYYNDQGRYEEAALHAERASGLGRTSLHASLQRVVAYYHLGRFEEGLALLNSITYARERKALVIFWKARFLDKLGRDAEAEAHFRQCNGLVEEVAYMVAFAEFLAARDRWSDTAEWVDRALQYAPNEQAALRLRAQYRQRGLAARGGATGGDRSSNALGRAVRRSTDWVQGAVRALPVIGTGAGRAGSKLKAD